VKICIDPGHSGPVEPGACAGGFTEAAINLGIAVILGELLIGKGCSLPHF
jgi:N-acetylmuramoyl-L-alanine amidase